MKYKFHLFSLLLIAFLTACSDDDNDTGISNEFVVAFENQNYSFTNSDTDREINLVFSEEASQSGTISITYTENGLIYGTDFSTTPQANSGIIEIPFEAGTTGTSFTFEKLTPNPIEGEELESVTFLIAEVTNGFSQGNTTFTANYFDAASAGGSVAPELGGPNQGNQVYVDLSTGTEKIVERDRWDLAFYSKDESENVWQDILYKNDFNLEYYASYILVNYLFDQNCTLHNHMNPEQFIKKMISSGFIQAYDYKTILN